jgi:hypothetical protein
MHGTAHGREIGLHRKLSKALGLLKAILQERAGDSKFLNILLLHSLYRRRGAEAVSGSAISFELFNLPTQHQPVEVSTWERIVFTEYTFRKNPL